MLLLFFFVCVNYPSSGSFAFSGKSSFSDIIIRTRRVWSEVLWC